MNSYLFPCYLDSTVLYDVTYSEVYISGLFGVISFYFYLVLRSLRFRALSLFLLPLLDGDYLTDFLIDSY